MNSRQAHKQLLLAESELNRIQLRVEWETMTDRVRLVSNQARTIGSLGSAAASFLFSASFFARTKGARECAKPLWWQTLLKGAQIAGSIWQVLCPSKSRQR